MGRFNKLQVLNQLIREINDGKDYHQVLDIIFEQLKGLVPFDRIAIATLDKRGQKLTLTALKSDGEIYLPIGYVGKLQGSSLELLIKTKQSRIINDLKKYLKNHPNSDSTSRIVKEGMLSNLTLPLIANGNPIGVVFFSSRKKNTYRQKHEKLFQEIAGELAITVEKSLLFEDLQKHNTELQKATTTKNDFLDRLQDEVEKRTSDLVKAKEKYRTLLEISNAINLKLDINAVFKTIISELKRLGTIDFDRASITLFDQAKGLFRFVALEPEKRNVLGKNSTIKFTGSALGQAIETGEPIIDHDLQERRRFYEDNLLAKTGTRSRVILPLLLKGKAIGTFNLASGTPKSYRDEEIEFLKEIAQQITISVASAKAYQEIARLKNELLQENVYLRDEIVRDHHFYEIIGTSPSLLFALRQAERVANTDSTVLIRGETGTGKELIARAIHRLSLRRDKALIKVNCSAVPLTLIESELFGHEPSAFVGAIVRKIGKFELASGGTIFLDEIADIPTEIQVKLLRAIQEKEIERVGGQEIIKVDVRIIAATNRDLEKMITEQGFREDIYYKFQVFPIQLPPLRERKEDIKDLTLHFVNKYSKKMNKKITNVDSEALETFLRYDWPGNVRELENIIERACIVCDSETIKMDHITLTEKSNLVGTRKFLSLEDLEKHTIALKKNYLLQVLKTTRGRIYGPNGAARLLSIKPTTLISRLKKLGIERTEYIV